MKERGQIENFDVDYWLQGAKNSSDFYRQVEQLTSSCVREFERRGGNRTVLV